MPCLLLQAAPKYALVPWYLRWLETMPVYVVVCLALVAFMLYLLRNALAEGVTKLFDMLVERLKRSSKEPASAADMTRKANKAIILEQAAERLRLQLHCDHVSVYGCQNGEYLRSGEGIDKFVMQAEASQPGDPRYMDTERIVYASDLPRLVLALQEQHYLLLWRGRCDDWKVNKLMSERDYVSAIAVFLRRPLKPGGTEMGVIGMYVVSWRECEIYRPDQSGGLPRAHTGPVRQIDAEFEQLLLAFAREFSYSM